MQVSDVEKFAKNLRHAIDLSGESQGEIAERAGMTGAYLSQILCRRIENPGVETLSRLAKAVNFSFRDLLEEPRKFMLEQTSREPVGV